jgi:hypothetical protein
MDSKLDPAITYFAERIGNDPLTEHEEEVLDLPAAPLAVLHATAEKAGASGPVQEWLFSATSLDAGAEDAQKYIRFARAKLCDQMRELLILSAMLIKREENPEGRLWHDEILPALAVGHKIKAIKAYRAATGKKLKESKEAIDAYCIEHPSALGPHT